MHDQIWAGTGNGLIESSHHSITPSKSFTSKFDPVHVACIESNLDIRAIGSLQ